MSFAGIAICILWIRAVRSYKSLNSAKFKIIIKMEKRLPVAAFHDEWELLKDAGGKRHTPFHEIEVLVPFVFIFVHAAQFMATIYWETLWDFAKSLFC